MATNTNQKEDWAAKELGAAWNRTSKKGTPYLKGTLKLNVIGIDKQVEFVAYTNNPKKADHHPDLKFYITEPKAAGQTPAAAAKVSRPATPRVQAPVAPDPTVDDQLI